MQLSSRIGRWCLPGESEKLTKFLKLRKFDGVSFDVMKKSAKTKDNEQPLNRSERRLYNNLKKSFEEIRLHQEGKMQLKTIEEFLHELQSAKN